MGDSYGVPAVPLWRSPIQKPVILLSMTAVSSRGRAARCGVLTTSVLDRLEAYFFGDGPQFVVSERDAVEDAHRGRERGGGDRFHDPAPSCGLRSADCRARIVTVRECQSRNARKFQNAARSAATSGNANRPEGPRPEQPLRETLPPR